MVQGGRMNLGMLGMYRRIEKAASQVSKNVVFEVSVPIEGERWRLGLRGLISKGKVAAEGLTFR